MTRDYDYMMCYDDINNIETYSLSDVTTIIGTKKMLKFVDNREDEVRTITLVNYNDVNFMTFQKGETITSYAYKNIIFVSESGEVCNIYDILN